MRKKNNITEQKIIYRYLNKLNFNKSETFNFNNDAAFLKKRKNKEIVVTNDTIVESVDFFKSDPAESIAQKIIKYFLTLVDYDLEKGTEKSNDNPVFYVQYAYARINSIFRLLKLNLKSMIKLDNKNFFLNHYEIEILKKIS